MEIVVLVKQVPDTESLIQISGDGKTIKTEDIKWVMNPYDEFAVEEALRIREAQGGTVTILTAGPQKATETIRTALAMGADKGVHINDAAAALLLMSEQKAKDLNLKPLVRIRAFASAGTDPAYMGLGPVPAIRKVLSTTGMSLDAFDTIELNEAFAAQAIGCLRELGLENDRPNELGSGISLGHPIGCTGARQMVTGMYQMQRKNYSTGLVTMCIGGKTIQTIGKPRESD